MKIQGIDLEVFTLVVKCSCGMCKGILSDTILTSSNDIMLLRAEEFWKDLPLEQHFAC